MGDWLNEAEHRTWRNVLRMHTRLTTALAQALKTASNMSISAYAVLAILSAAPAGVLRARQLRRAPPWETSRRAHHLRPMAPRANVRRVACVDDARAPLLGVTDTGLAAIRAAAPAHVPRVRDRFFAPLTPAQPHAMREATDAVLTNL